MCIADHIRRFVDKCGGPAKVREGRRALSGIRADSIADYVRRVAETDAGAKMLFAAALLGYVIAEMVCNKARTGGAGPASAMPS